MVDCHEEDGYGEDIINALPGSVVDVLILTHQHYDHFDGIEKLINADITVKEIWESPYSRRYNDNSVSYEEWQDYQRLVRKLESRGALRYSPSRSSQVYDTIGGASFRILNPVKNINDYETRELHDASLVIEVSIGRSRVLFCGDASDWALDRVRETYYISSAYILHASHHGSLNGANLEFVKEVSPEYTIVSTKSGVHENIPHPTALSRYRSYSRKAVYRTDTDGTQVFRFN